MELTPFVWGVCVGMLGAICFGWHRHIAKQGEDTPPDAPSEPLPMSKVDQRRQCLRYANHLLEQQEAVMEQFVKLHDMELWERGSDHLTDCIMNIPTDEGYRTALTLLLRERYPNRREH